MLSSSSTITDFFSRTLIKLNSPSLFIVTMSLHSHVFAGNPIRSRTPKPSEPLSPQSALQTLRTLLLSQTNEPISPDFKVLPFRKGRPLAGSKADGLKWHLGWLSLSECKAYLENSEVGLSDDSLVYLGCEYEDDIVYWAIDVSDASGLVSELGARQFCFVELRTLMVATDWADSKAMGELAVAGHVSFGFPNGLRSLSQENAVFSVEFFSTPSAPNFVLGTFCPDGFWKIFLTVCSFMVFCYMARALLEWHNTARFCGHCGGKAVSMEAGKRKQCSNELCKRRIYPRLDPVVIMLVIDKENDRALLSRQSRFVPRMWSCLAGFIEPGESLEEAVRRETWEETGIEIGEVVYHSSQPWPDDIQCNIIMLYTAMVNGTGFVVSRLPAHLLIDLIYNVEKHVGPSSMPCQLMIGFFAYAKTLEINVDKEELEDAKWHNRDDVKKALTFAEYKKAQKTAAAKVEQMCKGVEKGQNLSSDFNVESGELAAMFVPGPFAIAHHLITSWANQQVLNGVQVQKQATSSLSNL
ncbi:hypothetical protein DH2020_041452 [Rehmannia glutinosa]|uniref:NAD(+) diphosphatase n=1 Tax=Rehmannia glutinosa TaxID=99300 RepID=A0ABR0UR97_REHGL